LPFYHRLFEATQLRRLFEATQLQLFGAGSTGEACVGQYVLGVARTWLFAG